MKRILWQNVYLLQNNLSMLGQSYEWWENVYF